MLKMKLLIIFGFVLGVIFAQDLVSDSENEVEEIGRLKLLLLDIPPNPGLAIAHLQRFTIT